MKIAPILTFQEVDKNRKINCVDILKGALCSLIASSVRPALGARNGFLPLSSNRGLPLSSFLSLSTEEGGERGDGDTDTLPTHAKREKVIEVHLEI